MKKSLALFALPILLAACSKTLETSDILQSHLENPLYADRYFTALVDTMVDIEIGDQEYMKTHGSTVQTTKDRALERAKLERAKIKEGTQGAFVPAGQAVQGTTLLTANTLYFGTDFITDPGPSLHVYLTKAVEPRDVQFPDETAIDLGVVKNTYGAQTYPLQLKEDPKSYITVALYDTQLKRLYGFAQLRDN